MTTLSDLFADVISARIGQPTAVQIARALAIKASLGTRTAAGYLRNRGVSICYAVDILARVA